MTREELLSKISAVEYDDWWLLESVDPWGQRRDDLRFAKLALHIMQSTGTKREDGKPWSVGDFLLRFEIDREVAEPEKPMPASKIEFYIRMWAKAANARFAQQPQES